MTPPAEEPDPLAHLVRQGYDVAPPTDSFVQSLGLRLDRELDSVRQRRRVRRWRLRLALAALVLLGCALGLLAVKPTTEAPAGTEPGVIGKERPDSAPVPETFHPAR
jgi:hypothetical protein